MKIIQGKKIADRISADLKKEIKAKKIKPVLGVILAGHNPASRLYLRLKEKAAQKVGIEIKKYNLVSSISEKAILEIIASLNQDSKIDWQQRKKQFRDHIISSIERKFMPDLQQHIKAEKIMTPADFEELHSDYKGAVFSLAPTFTQSAWFRPHNESEDIEGLYLVGAGTHPGGGIPGVLTSAKLTSNQILQTSKFN